MPYVHNSESTWKILRTLLLKKENRHLGKLAIDKLDSSMKKMDADSKAKEKNPVSTCHLLG